MSTRMTATDGTQVIGTPAYMSPEMLAGEAKDPAACDSYAMGMLIWSMLSADRHPYAGSLEKNRFTMMVKIMKGLRPQLDPDWPAALRTMMESCWAESAQDRPTFEQLSQSADARLSELDKWW